MSRPAIEPVPGDPRELRALALKTVADAKFPTVATVERDQPRLRVLRHAVNRGKGAALRSGFAQASAPVVLVHDADAEYDARQIARVAAPILAGEADVVYGSRFQGRPLAGVFLLTDGNANDIKNSLPDLTGVPPVYPVVIGKADAIKDISVQQVSVTQTAFEDAVHGRIEFDGSNIEDFVIVRSDGQPVFHFVNVVDDQDALTGVFTDGDLRRVLDRDVDIKRAKLSTYMVRDFVKINANQLAAQAVDLMEKHKVSAMPVVDDASGDVAHVLADTFFRALLPSK